LLGSCLELFLFSMVHHFTLLNLHLDQLSKGVVFKLLQPSLLLLFHHLLSQGIKIVISNSLLFELIRFVLFSLVQLLFGKCFHIAFLILFAQCYHILSGKEIAQLLCLNIVIKLKLIHLVKKSLATVFVFFLLGCFHHCIEFILLLFLPGSLFLSHLLIPEVVFISP